MEVGSTEAALQKLLEEKFREAVERVHFVAALLPHASQHLIVAIVTNLE